MDPAIRSTSPTSRRSTTCPWQMSNTGKISRILEMRHDADGTLAEVIVKDPAHTLLTPPRSSITSLAAAHVPPIEPAPPSEQPG